MWPTRCYEGQRPASIQSVQMFSIRNLAKSEPIQYGVLTNHMQLEGLCSSLINMNTSMYDYV